MAPVVPSVKHTADSSAVRAALRRDKLAARNALAAAPLLHAARSAAIENHLRQRLAALPPQTIAFCAPVRGEFDARPLIAELLESGWLAAMPVVVKPAAAMHFYRWTPETTMATDRHGIPVPAIPDNCTPSLVLLPLLAFDIRGYRLGYGGGYFDRTLAAMVPRPHTLGVGFELGRMSDIQPEAHDIPLDEIITEDGLLLINH